MVYRYTSFLSLSLSLSLNDDKNEKKGVMKKIVSTMIVKKK